MPAQLVALTEGPNILLDKPVLLIGRHPECDIQVESRKVSRRHCCIAQVGNHLVVRDLGSTNGVRINGKRVVEGRLQDGDELTIGNNRFQVSWNPVEESPRPVREAPRVVPVPLGDEALEDCDDPVPLPDPDNPEDFSSTARANHPGSIKPTEEPPSGPILPDDLRLRSGSDIQPVPPGQ